MRLGVFLKEGMGAISVGHEPWPLPAWLPKNRNIMSKDRDVPSFSRFQNRQQKPCTIQHVHHQMSVERSLCLPCGQHQRRQLSIMLSSGFDGFIAHRKWTVTMLKTTSDVWSITWAYHRNECPSREESGDACLGMVSRRGTMELVLWMT